MIYTVQISLNVANKPSKKVQEKFKLPQLSLHSRNIVWNVLAQKVMLPYPQHTKILQIIRCQLCITNGKLVKNLQVSF